MIALHELAVGFRQASKARALFTVSASIAAGGITAILGANGAGKSTCLKTILGFASPLSGSVLIYGLTPHLYRTQATIGYLPESGSLPLGLTSDEFLRRVALAAGLHGEAAAHAITAATHIAAIDFSTTRKIGALSKGMRQRVGLAAALCPMPKVLLLDEPESGLDPMQRTALRQALTRLAGEGMVVLVSSHDFDAVCSYASQILLVRGTRCDVIDDVTSYTPAELVRLIATGGAT
ncbi:ATP-binding cassette domain-containing protein [Gemmatimonas sp.]|uniref:ATP-binding cassette domain-containing protein n=1 Tax=Gemmatimonas sp. TaxID=1962908 RepID=UPI003DA60639